jgi:CheY-like chemotaxis protein
VVVDDDRSMLFMARFLLDQCGFESTATNNLEGFTAARERAPGMVLLDLNMPERCSERVVAELQASAAPPPVVFMTAASEDEIERRRCEAEAGGLRVAAVLRKPFWLPQLQDALGRVFPSLAGEAATA